MFQFKNIKIRNFIKIAFVNIGILSFFMIFIISILEITLRVTTKFDQLDSPNPSYIPHKLKKIDHEIKKKYILDIDGFRSIDGHNKIDFLRESQGEKCNIVILGDSFVWGAGLNVGDIWVNKLNEKTECKIHSFGRSGWSSLEQFEFYHARLKTLSFDHLIIGFVLNDPHLSIGEPKKYYHYPKDKKYFYGDINKKERLLRGSIDLRGFKVGPKIKKINLKSSVLSYANLLSKPLDIFVRAFNKIGFRSIDYIDQRLSSISKSIFNGHYKVSDEQILTLGYTNWRSYLYQEQNFEEWQKALFRFKNDVSHPATFVITETSSTNKQDDSNSLINKSKKAINSAGFNTLDCAIRYKKFRPRSAWATITDGHPGKSESEKIAKCVKYKLDLN